MNGDISGDLENTRCSEVIKILSLGKRSGRLHLSNGGDTGSIFFRISVPIPVCWDAWAATARLTSLLPRMWPRMLLPS